MQKIRICVRVDVETLIDLDKIAETQGIKLSEVVRDAIDDYITAQKKRCV